MRGFLGNVKRGWMAEGNPSLRIQSPSATRGVWVMQSGVGWPKAIQISEANPKARPQSIHNPYSHIFIE
ncbi:MAG: hypothetical protein A2472_08010 [Sphingobacteriia bacterium RIFOXYC2_FULL_35_18]|nr:MAG: hypothetical protein A2472_08010 [Sphingobacteriia bacterium RIFOXYC2_FULL_35_18]